MREIEFRGKRIDNGEWVYGSLVKYKNGTAAIYCEELSGHFPIPVIPETVGQYTGLCDKNGKRVFEGDIAKSKNKETQNKTPYEKDFFIKRGS